MRTSASHGTGKGRSSRSLDRESRPSSGSPCFGQRAFPLSFLLGLALVALPCLGCEGEGPGGNQNLNDNIPDAGLDSQVPPDAWTFDCPATQPDGHICLRGQVRRLVDDSPVAIPGGALIQRLVPAPGEDRPTVLQAETEVQEDGRFIFPSVEVYLRQEATEEVCTEVSSPDCYPCRYDHFDLVMPGDDVLMVGDGTGFHVPRNRYGVAQGRPWQGATANDPANYIFGFYLLGRDTFDTWAEVWPGRVSEEVEPPPPWCDEWCGLDQPFTSEQTRLIIPMCYFYWPTFPAPTELPINLLPGPSPEPGSRIELISRSSHTVPITPECMTFLYPERLDYPSRACGDWPSSTTFGLWWFDPSIDPTARISFACITGLVSGCVGSGDSYAAFATFSAADGYEDGHIVIVHSMAHEL